MMGLSYLKMAAALAKHMGEMVEKPSEGGAQSSLTTDIGIQLIVNPNDPFDINADITGPTGTPYDGGIFHCTLKLDHEFPQKPPKGYFLTKIFHPNVSLAGEICVNTLKKDWDPMNWSLRHIFEVIRCLLIVPFPESSLNEEAGRLFMDNYEEYARTAAVYCHVYAKKKPQPCSPGPAASENHETLLPVPLPATKSPTAKMEEPREEGSKTAGKSDEVLGTLTLNPSAGEQKPTPKPAKPQQHTPGDKKKWMKRI